MSFTNWALNIILLLVCGAVLSFYSKAKKVTIVTLFLSYAVLYFIGYGLHTDMLNAITIRPNGLSISLLGIILLGFITYVFNLIYLKYFKRK